jgi:hypothetical protein
MADGLIIVSHGGVFEGLDHKPDHEKTKPDAGCVKLIFKNVRLGPKKTLISSFGSTRGSESAFPPEHIFLETSGTLSIGRSRSNDLVQLDCPTLSRKQCELSWDKDGNLLIQNFSEANPTLINGDLALATGKPKTLVVGDTVSMGCTDKKMLSFSALGTTVPHGGGVVEKKVTAVVPTFDSNKVLGVIMEIQDPRYKLPPSMEENNNGINPPEPAGAAKRSSWRNVGMYLLFGGLSVVFVAVGLNSMVKEFAGDAKMLCSVFQ